MSKNHIMVDIETLGTGVTAPVLSIAAVAFQPGVRQEDYPAFMATVSPNDQPDRPIEYDTVKWWMNQSKEAAGHWVQAEPIPVFRALCELKEWAKQNQSSDTDETCWWAYSPQFDYVILESLYREWSLDYPWTYRDLRDVRTIRPYLKDQSSAPRTVAHHPLYDCTSQIEYVHRFYEQMGLV